MNLFKRKDSTKWNHFPFFSANGASFAWGCVQFISPRERNNLLAQHERKKKTINNHMLDIKGWTKPNKDAEVTTVRPPPAAGTFAPRAQLGAAAAQQAVSAAPVAAVAQQPAVTTTRTTVEIPSDHVQVK